ncbi:MAG: transposase [Euryarchaeota archaeon]|nr:transposase [Euryarchaeota archaeon]
MMLRRLIEGRAKWSEIKNYLEAKEGRTLTVHVLANLLRNFVNSGFIEKENDFYYISDPILTQAVRKGLS